MRKIQVPMRVVKYIHTICIGNKKFKLAEHDKNCFHTHSHTQAYSFTHILHKLTLPYMIIHRNVRCRSKAQHQNRLTYSMRHNKYNHTCFLTSMNF